MGVRRKEILVLFLVIRYSRGRYFVLLDAVMARFHENWTLVCICDAITVYPRLDHREICYISSVVAVRNGILDFPQFI